MQLPNCDACPPDDDLGSQNCFYDLADATPTHFHPALRSRHPASPARQYSIGGTLLMRRSQSESREPVAIFDNAYASTLAFVDSLGQRGVPLHVYGARGLGFTRWSRYRSRYARCPSIDRPDEFLPWLRQQIRSGAITRVAPTSDLLAYYLSELRDEFSESVRQTIPPLAEIESCLIKSRFAAACTAKGINTPATAAPATIGEALSFAEQVGYPLVLKAKSHLAVGMAERGTVVENGQQLRERFVAFAVVPGHESIAARYPELRLPLLQRFIPSADRRVYSVSGFKHAQLGIVSAAVSYKREQWPPKVGISTHQVGSASEQILQLGLLAVDQLVSCGIFELELLIDGDHLLAIDLNPRSFGFMNLDIARGSDLPWLWYLATHNQLPLLRAISQLPVMESRQSLPFFVSRLVMLLSGPRRRQQWRQFRNELRSSWVSMTGQWHDPAPKLLALFSVLRHPGSLVRPYWRASRQWHIHGNALQPNHVIKMADTEIGDVRQRTVPIEAEQFATGAYPTFKISSRPHDSGS
jgi:D-aspartate ligase